MAQAPSTGLLEDAIENLTAKRARVIIRAILAHNASNRELAEKLLLVDSSKVRSVKRSSVFDLVSSEAESSSENESSSGSDSNADAEERDVVEPSRKRQKRYDMCRQCNEDFDVTKNEKNDCRWHPGESLAVNG